MRWLLSGNKNTIQPIKHNRKLCSKREARASLAIKNYTVTNLFKEEDQR
jgi:hypothetical protein